MKKYQFFWIQFFEESTIHHHLCDEFNYFVCLVQ